jgi:3-oxoacyl-(acyl-carrier-protein) synthase
VLIANAICGTRLMETEFVSLTDSGRARLDPRRASRALYQSSTFNAASAEVAARNGFRGPCLTLSTGCTAGLDAIGMAAKLIRSGDADVMVTGASEAPITPIALAAFDVIGALSTGRNALPERASRPFDAGRDGFVLAEGCGILLLEERGHALARGAEPMAEVRGFGSCNNAYHMTDLPPDGADLARSIQLALENARIAPSEVDCVSAHGSSTKQNDTNETAAYKRVFGERAYDIPVTGLKSMTGHALAAANAIESVAAVLTLATGEIPPTINHEEPDPVCDLDYVPNVSVRRDVNVLVKNASGFSGIHSAAVYTSHEA